MKRTLFIGDIHGCYDEFIELLDKINYNPASDSLYLTGDLINKGAKGYEVIDFLIKNPQIKSVIGNNEVNFLRKLYNILPEKFKEIDNKNLINNGLKDKTYDKKNSLFDNYLKQFKEEHLNYLFNLPLYIETDNWILLHGGLVPGKRLEEHSLDEITRIREYNGSPWYEYYFGAKTIIYGHWAADGLRIRKNTKGLDSGCVYGKWLTAYCFETGEIWQVSAKKLYLKPEI